MVGTSQGKPLLSSLIPPLSSRFSLSVLYLSFSLSLCLSVCHVESDLVFDSGLSVFCAIDRPVTFGVHSRYNRHPFQDLKKKKLNLRAIEGDQSEKVFFPTCILYIVF